MNNGELDMAFVDELFDISALQDAEIREITPDELAIELKQSLDASVIKRFLEGGALETYLKQFANAAIAANFFKRQHKTEWRNTLFSILSGTATDLPAIRTLSCGLSYLKLDRCILLQFPGEEICQSQELVVNALNSLSSEIGSTSHWVMDFSACKTIDPSVLAYLLGFQRSLREDAKLLLLWLKQSSVPEALLPAVQKNFNLRLRGSFLISE